MYYRDMGALLVIHSAPHHDNYLTLLFNHSIIYFVRSPTSSTRCYKLHGKLNIPSSGYKYVAKREVK